MLKHRREACSTSAALVLLTDHAKLPARRESYKTAGHHHQPAYSKPPKHLGYFSADGACKGPSDRYDCGARLNQPDRACKNLQSVRFTIKRNTIKQLFKHNHQFLMACVVHNLQEATLKEKLFAGQHLSKKMVNGVSATRLALFQRGRCWLAALLTTGNHQRQ